MFLKNNNNVELTYASRQMQKYLHVLKETGWGREDTRKEIWDWPQNRTDDVSVGSGSGAMKGQQSSVICGKQSVNTICFTIDVEGTDLVDFTLWCWPQNYKKQNNTKEKVCGRTFYSVMMKWEYRHAPYIGKKKSKTTKWNGDSL